MYSRKLLLVSCLSPSSITTKSLLSINGCLEEYKRELVYYIKDIAGLIYSSLKLFCYIYKQGVL